MYFSLLYIKQKFPKMFKLLAGQNILNLIYQVMWSPIIQVTHLVFSHQLFCFELYTMHKAKQAYFDKKLEMLILLTPSLPSFPNDYEWPVSQTPAITAIMDNRSFPLFLDQGKCLNTKLVPSINLRSKHNSFLSYTASNNCNVSV